MGARRFEKILKSPGPEPDCPPLGIMLMMTSSILLRKIVLRTLKNTFLIQMKILKSRTPMKVTTYRVVLLPCLMENLKNNLQLI